MTHTLHRRGSEKELQKDFVILAMAARGVNREGACQASSELTPENVV